MTAILKGLLDEKHLRSKWASPSLDQRRIATCVVS